MVKFSIYLNRYVFVMESVNFSVGRALPLVEIVLVRYQHLLHGVHFMVKITKCNKYKEYMNPL